MTSQRKKILIDLKNGMKIDQLHAIKQYGCLRLSSRIFEIRQAGYNVITDMSRNYATYYMK